MGTIFPPLPTEIGAIPNIRTEGSLTILDIQISELLDIKVVLPNHQNYHNHKCLLDN